MTIKKPQGRCPRSEATKEAIETGTERMNNTGAEIMETVMKKPINGYMRKAGNRRIQMLIQRRSDKLGKVQ